MKTIFVLAILLQLFSICSPKKSGGSRLGGGSSFSGSRSGSSFGFGSNTGISKSGTSRTIAAALGGAAVGYVGARITHRLSSGTTSVFIPNYHRTYYYGDENYNNTNFNETLVCRYYISDNDEVFNILDEDGDRVTEIVYECNAKSEQCCNGLDCCIKAGFPWWKILIIAIGSFALILIISAKLAPLCSRFLKRSKSVTPADHVIQTERQISAVQNAPIPLYPSVLPQQKFDDTLPTYPQTVLSTGYPNAPAYQAAANTNMDLEYQAPPEYHPQNDYPTKENL